MIKVAARPPNKNAELIQNGLKELGFQHTSSLLQQFNIGIGTQMAVVPGRILPPPQILYGGNKSMKADNASWNLRDIKFQVGATLEKWGVLNLRDRGKVSGQ
jgi:eukaryotic translation initiation factor 2C